MTNKYADICSSCGKDGTLIFGSDGVYCSDCKHLESWDSYHKRNRELKN